MMAGINITSHDRNQSLKEALLESLLAILSPCADARASGEQQLKTLEVTEEFGVHLAEFTVGSDVALAIRQLSSVLLKQYVELHWCKEAPKYTAPETTEAAKAVIREILPLGLHESISKVRSSVAYAVSAIAHWDWPEAWPQLFQILMAALTSGNQNAVHGAMRVLTEFVREVTDHHMLHVAPVILPEMLKIFTQAEVYSVRTRARAVDIFHTCSTLIAAMNEIDKGVARQLLLPFLADFCRAMIAALQQPDGLISDSGLKMEILKLVSTLVKNFPKVMAGWLSEILPPVWNILTQSTDRYVCTVVNNTEEADNAVDSDGEVLGFENLVDSIFEFIMCLIDVSKFRSTVKGVMNELLYYIMLYMQITEDQEREWTNNPDQFVEDEDEETFSYSVRISAQDLLLSVCSEFPKESGVSLVAAISRHVQESLVSKENGNPNWWKVHEAVLLSVGSVFPLLTQKSGHQIEFDIPSFIHSVILADLNLPVSPFLTGRCLWTASRFTDMLSPEFVQKFLVATVKALQADQPANVRISAVRAIGGFMSRLKMEGTTDVLQPFLNDILESLIIVAQTFSQDVMALCLETLVTFVSVDEAFTSSVEHRVIPLGIAIFLKYCNDPVITTIVEDLFKTLCENPACVEPLQQRLVPTLTSILMASDDKVAVAMQATALDVLAAIVRACPVPLSDLLMNQAFPATTHCTLHTDDLDSMQNGGEVLRVYVSKSLAQVCSWQDVHGQHGIDLVIQVIWRLLDPKTAESTASFVGRLVSTLITKMGDQLAGQVDLMLRAVLSKMQQAETVTVMQSLLMVFAHLINSQLEAVLQFLCSVPGPAGTPALDFVLTEWCSKQQLFFGSYERKVSSTALVNLLQHALKTDDHRLQNLSVRGEPIFHLDGPRTRSKAAEKPEQWTSIPVLVKIYKLLINELSSQLENSQAKVETDEWIDADEDEDDEADGANEELESGDYFSQLTKLAAFEEEDDENDPEYADDPIGQIDLQAFLTQFLQNFSQQACYPMFSAHHNDTEKAVLSKISIEL